MDESNGCGMYTERTVLTWLKLGGRRLDCANSYGSQKAVGRAMKASGIDRKDIFITQKVGPPPSVPLGYADTMIQMDQMLRDMQTDYVDLLLIHQRVQDIPQAADPYCNKGSPVYSERDCRLSTWRALLDIFKQGKALSVGVSNWNIADLQEIEDAGLPMPAVNQVPFNLYHSSKQQAMREYCASKGILFHGYSALGAPDVFTFPFNNTGMVTTHSTRYAITCPAVTPLLIPDVPCCVLCLCGAELYPVGGPVRAADRLYTQQERCADIDPVAVQ